MMFKTIIISIFASLVSLPIFGQGIEGSWRGAIEVQDGVTLPLVFNVAVSDEGTFSATMDSPDQGAYGIKASSITLDGATIKIAVTSIGVSYNGTLSDDGTTIKGRFEQGFAMFPLILERTKASTAPNRPQEPVTPYPYTEEEVTFNNEKDGITMSGTLTIPNDGKGQYPALILISGSGAQDRNEEVVGHKPFLVLADYLTRNGYAVLRYDDRGVGGSTGNYNEATTYDLANDAEAAFDYLLTRDDIDHDKIGLAGHSEGGTIAPMVAAKNSEVAFIILMAGTGIKGDSLLLMQQELVGRAMGMSEEELTESRILNEQVFAQISTTDKPDTLQFDFLTPWLLYFLKYDPAPVLEQVECPVLAINGDKDLQVPSLINLKAIRTALEKGGNSSVTIVELAGLNHLFQESSTGSPLEYAKIEQTIAPIALDTILKWLNQNVK